MSQRDFQKTRIYDSEESLQLTAQRLNEMADMDGYVQKVMSLEGFKYFFPKLRSIALKDGRRTRRGLSWKIGDHHGIISMPRWTRNTTYLLHEISHVVTLEEEPFHGEHFAANLIKLVWIAEGRQRANELWVNYRMLGVKIHKEVELGNMLSNEIWQK